MKEFTFPWSTCPIVPTRFSTSFKPDQQSIIPMFTCGFDRSKTVAIPRAPCRSAPKTCCTGLKPLRWRRTSRAVLRRGVKERLRFDIVTKRKLGRREGKNLATGRIDN